MCVTLQGIHARGYLHNDIKEDQIAVEINEAGDVKATLLDLGCMTRIGERPYAFDYTDDPDLMLENEKKR